MLVDTAGLRDSADTVETIGIDRARSEAERADLLLWLGEPDAAPPAADLILIASKADLGQVGEGLPVSAVTREGLDALMRLMLDKASVLVPKADELALDRRQHLLLTEALEAIQRATDLRDPILAAEELRTARHAIDRIGGRAGVEDLLDALFGRFCLGK